MPSLVERALGARHHNTATHSPNPATESEPNPPADQATSTTGAADPDRAVPDRTTPQSLVPEQDPAAEPHHEISSTTPRIRIARTKVSGAWVAVTVAAVGLVVLLIFILQNLTSASVHFLGANGTLPMGVAMLLAAVAGALLLALLGSARILQLRRAAHRRNR
jgi:uncharacterized integral membrane protein